MKKAKFLASGLLIIAMLVPNMVALAHFGPPPGPPPQATMTVEVTAKRAWHYDGSEFPALGRLSFAWVFPCGVTSFKDARLYIAPFMADDVTVHEDFRIASVVYKWFSFVRGRIKMHTGIAQGTCAGGAVPLVTMYVAYAPDGFYEFNGGVVNTITLMSEFGPPSKDRVAYWAGMAPEDLPVYTFPCSDIVYDDGTDMGSFGCDAFLKSVGERRGWLRNDPQGPDTDLLPKIHSYLSQLDELGILP